MNFLKRGTKVKCIVASVLTALALITLVMLTSLLSVNSVSKLTLTLVYTLSLMLILLLWQGALQICVFNDYRSKRGYLCADGIISICMGILLIISGILFSVLQLDKLMQDSVLVQQADIRIFLSSFAFIIAMWKLAVTIISIKEKHYNWICELGFTILWLALAVFCIITMITATSSLLWVIVALGWALITLTIFYMLFSYVIKTPKYLETESLIKEIEEEQKEQERLKESKNNTNQSFRLQEKLKKLKELKDQNLITEKEYTYKRNQLLDTF